MTLTSLIAALALVLAVAAGIWRRRDPWSVRITGVIAVVAAFVAARDRQVTLHESQPPDLIAIVVGGEGTPPIAEQVARHVRDAEVSIVRAASPELGVTLATTSLDRPDAELVLIWNGPLARSPATPAAARARHALTTTPAARIEPDDFELRALGSWRAGRPGAVELRAHSPRTLPPATELHLRLLDASGALLAERRAFGSDLATPLTLELDPVPIDRGPFSLHLDATAAPTHLHAIASIEPAPAPRIGVIGASPTLIIDALRIQGVDAFVLDPQALEDPAELPSELGVVIALDPLSDAAQHKLARFVTERGGGLFVVGGADGGALAAPGEPLHDLLPVEVLPLAENPRTGDAAGVEPADSDREPADLDPPLVDPPESEPQAKPPSDPDTAEAPIEGAIEGANPPGSIAPPRVEVERRRVAMVLVIDESGSMSTLVGFGRSRIDYAKRAAFDTARALDPDDLLAIVTFADAVRVRRPLGKIPTPGELQNQIEQIGAVGSATFLDLGLAAAFEQMESADVAIQHVVLLTDGDAISPIRLNNAEVLATNMRDAGITVSVVHVSSSDTGPILTPFDRIAKAGGGRLVATGDASAVPRLIVTEVRRVRGGTDGVGESPEDDAPRPDPSRDPAEPRADDVAVEPPQPPAEPPADPDPPDSREEAPSDTQQPSPNERKALAVRAVTDGPLIEPLPGPAADSRYPAIGGIVDNAGRPDAWIVFVAGDRGLPLLAFANRGLGRIAAWSADWTGVWGGAWRDDADFSARLAQWVAHLEPASADPALRASLPTDSELTPTAPLRAEVQRLHRLVVESGGAAASTAVAGAATLLPLADYVPPARRLVARRESRAVDDALLALLAALLLACIEFAVRRL